MVMGWTDSEELGGWVRGGVSQPFSGSSVEGVLNHLAEQMQPRHILLVSIFIPPILFGPPHIICHTVCKAIVITAGTKTSLRACFSRGSMAVLEN